MRPDSLTAAEKFSATFLAAEGTTMDTIKSKLANSALEGRDFAGVFAPFADHLARVSVIGGTQAVALHSLAQ